MKRKVFAYPYIVWMVLFIAAPMLFVLYYAFTKDGSFSLAAVTAVLKKGNYLISLWDSVRTAFITTLICLLLGYPVAYILSNMKKSVAALLSVFFIVPMWMNFLLRTYAWQSILGDFLPAVFKTENLLNNNGAVMLGLVYNFLPFMILPLYTTLSKMDRSYMEAARDLGANGVVTFFRVVLPLSVSGVISGITMVFIPSITAFAVPKLLGGGMTNTLYGELIEYQIKQVNAIDMGSAMSVVLLICVIISTVIMNRFEKDHEEGGKLW